MTDELIRTVRLRPYLRGMGPTYTLRVWDTGTTGEYGKARLAYELREHENRKTTVLFTGRDFFASPMHAIDSDSTVSGLLAFLTLQPGDTDAEYFANYTPRQMAYVEMHAELLDMDRLDRFGD